MAADSPRDDPGHASRRAEVTLVDRDGLLVQARWGENGTLVITGQDLAELPWEAREYEYGIGQIHDRPDR